MVFLKTHTVVQFIQFHFKKEIIKQANRANNEVERSTKYEKERSGETWNLALRETSVKLS